MNRYFKTSPGKYPGAATLWGLFLLLTVGFALPTQAQFTAVSRAITAETCTVNGVLDPGETNTVSFVIKNTSGGTLANVKASLAASGGVTFPSGQVTIGSMANNQESTVSFTFRTDGTCAGSLTPTLAMTVNDVATQNLAFPSFELGLRVLGIYTFTGGAVTINDFTTANSGKATPYPSPVVVANVPNSSTVTGERVSKVEVDLTGINHTFSPDLQVLLVGPDGSTKVMLMNDAGGQTTTTGNLSNVTLTFKDDAAAQLPQNAQITSGSYKPSNFAPADTMPSGAPAGPYGTLLGDFGTSTRTTTYPNPNGTWNLYVVDDNTGDTGSISGWTLRITTTRIECCGAGQTGPAISAIANTSIAEDALNQTVATFTISDLESAASALTTRVTSSQPSIVPDASLVIEGGTAATRTIKVTAPATNSFGATVITVFVKDPENHESSTQFTLTVNSVNDAPTITQVRNQSVNVGTATSPLSFTIGDVETDVNSLVLVGTVVTENPAGTVPPQNIFFSGSGANRTVQVFPASSTTSGTATIRVTVNDANGGSTPMDFIVAFNVQAGYPTVTPISADSTNEDTTKSIGFSVRAGSGDGSAVGSLVVTATSNDLNIVAANGLTISTPDPNQPGEKILTITPVSNASSTTPISITVTVTDNRGTSATSDDRVSSSTFAFTVNPVNDTPTITAISAQSTSEETPTGAIAFTIGDIETAATSLTLSATSSDASVVPSTVVSDAAVPGIMFGGSGATRTVTIRPNPDAFGKTTITITVTDATGGSTGTASTLFALTVNAANDNPVIASANGVNLAANATDAPTAITINEDQGDVAIPLAGVAAGPANETDQTVTVTAQSSDPAKLQIRTSSTATSGGPVTLASNSTFTLVTQGNQNGSVVITLVVTDNLGASITRKFTVVMTPVNDAPKINGGTALPDITIPKNTGITVNLAPSDVETAVANLTVTAVSGAGDQAIINNSKVVVSADKTRVSIIPESNAVGNATITVSITDTGEGSSGALTVTDAFVVTVADITPATISLSPTTQTINEDTVGSSTITVTGTGTLNITANSNNQTLVPNGNIVISGSGGTRTLVVVPASNEPRTGISGSAVVTVTVTDGNGTAASATYTLTVIAVEDFPSLQGLGALASSTSTGPGPTVTTLEGGVPVDSTTTPAGGSLKIRATDAEDGVLSNSNISVASSNTTLIPIANVVFGTPDSNGDRTVTINHAADQFGSAQITLTASDSTGRTSIIAFTIAVTAVSDAPTLDAIAPLNIAEDAAAQTINLTGISVGPANESPTELPITVTVNDIRNTGATATGTDVVTATVNYTSPATTGTLVITPAANKNGSVTVTIRVADNGTTANSGVRTLDRSFVVNVSSVNDLPTLTFTSANVSIPNGGFALVPFTIGDVETPAAVLGDSTHLTATSQNTAIIPNENLIFGGSDVNRSLRIAPTGTGSTTVTVVLTDNSGVSVQQILNVTVAAGANPSVTISPNRVQTTIGGETPAVTLSMSDPQSAATALTLTYSSTNTALVPNGSSFSVQMSTTTGSPRQIIIRPAANQFGETDIIFTATDPENNTGTATLHVTVGSVPTISTISNQSIGQGGSTTVQFTVSDAETASGFLTVSGNSSNTALVSNSNIVFGGSGASRNATITATTGQVGSSDIRITVSDAQGMTNSSLFTVTVANTVPTITAIAAQTISPDTSSGELAFTVSDAETASGFLTVTATSSNTTIIPNSAITISGTGASRTVRVSPATGQSGGPVTITLTVSDPQGGSAVTSFPVTVLFNNPPTISNISPQTTRINQATGIISFTVNDAETASTALTVNATSDNPTLVNPSANIAFGGSGSARSLIITPAANQTGIALITLTTTDGAGKTASTSFTLTVTANTAPTISPISDQSINKNTSTGAISISVSDAETASANLTLSATSDSQTLVPNSSIVLGGSGASRTVTVTPANNQVGTARITVSVADGSGGTSSRTFSVTVLQTPPVKGDLDADGKSDILFQDGDGFLAVWLMDNRNLKSASFLLPSNLGDINYRIAGTGDFNRDGQEDIIFQHNDGTMAVWLMSGTSQASAQLVSPSSTGDANWKIVAVADMDADQNPDLLFQHTDGSLAVWYMNGVTQRSASLLSPSNPGDRNWRVVGVGDFNSDGKQDLAFQHTDGTLAAWYMNGIAMTQPTFLTPSNPGAGWRVVGVTDRNSDGKVDLLFQHTDYSVAVWNMNGVTLSIAQLLNPSNSGATWRAVSPK